MGSLWPSWETRELGLGPQAITTALEEISNDDIASAWGRLHEIGAVAEFALSHKAQHPLSVSPLDALTVYDTLRRVSKMSGPESEHRKIAALMGLMLDASPLEGRYISRTAMGNMAAGLGPRTMIEAFSKSFGLAEDGIHKAYNLMPDLGRLALAARQGSIFGTEIKPTIPIRPMLFRKGDAIFPAAYLPVYPGLKVQVHMAKGSVCVYTARLKNITVALAGLAAELERIAHDMIIEAWLVGFQEGLSVSQAEVVRYINRRHFSRRSRTSPALLAYDILYQNGEDLTGLPYEGRRRRLIEILGEPKELPFNGLSSARETVLKDPSEAESYFVQAKKDEFKRLIAKDLSAPYHPGRCSSRDFLLRVEDASKAF